MAHILDGDWRSTIFNRRGEPLPDDRFHLVIDETTGEIKSGSTHEGHPVTGGVTPGGEHHHIIEVTNHRNHLYKGILIVNVHAPGGGFMLLCGARRLNAPMQTADRRTVVGDSERERGGKNDSAKESFELFDQEQIIWVATKP
jgi:hypothetical protein